MGLFKNYFVLFRMSLSDMSADQQVEVIEPLQALPTEFNGLESELKTFDTWLFSVAILISSALIWRHIWVVKTSLIYSSVHLSNISKVFTLRSQSKCHHIVEQVTQTIVL